MEEWRGGKGTLSVGRIPGAFGEDPCLVVSSFLEQTLTQCLLPRASTVLG